MASQDERRQHTGRNQCQNCNAYISQQFARVFGNNDDKVYACIRCSTLHALREGEAGEKG